MKSFAVLVLLVGCGGSDLDPGAGDDPGTGTSTLGVDGEISARPRVANGRVSADFDTHVSVRVTLADVPVTTGTVTITTAAGAVPLAGYDEVYGLDIVSGADTVDGVRVDGPDIHVFTSPTAGATVDSTADLMVAWTADQHASSISIEAEQLNRLAIVDTGAYMLPALSLKAERDKPVENRIEITRSNRVAPAGAIAGSSVEVSVMNYIDVVAQPNPAL